MDAVEGRAAPAAALSPTAAARTLVVTADDFGAAREVDEAVEAAHATGILTAASLMVSGRAAADAVARAKRLPSLGVGLHLVLVDGEPTLPASRVPDLLDRDGRFRDDMMRAGIAMFFRPAVRRQLAAEIEAQFAAFAKTGLALDHVNAHKHFHVHPTIGALAIAIGRRYGARSIRVPSEPRDLVRAVDASLGLATPGVDPMLGPTSAWLRRGVRRAGLRAPDRVVGIAWSGRMTTTRVVETIARLPHGCTELYTHPAVSSAHAGAEPGYAYAEELAALTSRDAREAVASSQARLAAFAALAVAP